MADNLKLAVVTSSLKLIMLVLLIETMWRIIVFTDKVIGEIFIIGHLTLSKLVFLAMETLMHNIITITVIMVRISFTKSQ